MIEITRIFKSAQFFQPTDDREPVRWTTQAIEVGDVVVATVGAVHRLQNMGSEPLSFISIVAPTEAGYGKV